MTTGVDDAHEVRRDIPRATRMERYAPRIAILLACGALAIVSAASALTGFLRSGASPVQTLRVSSNDPVALVRYGNTQLLNNPERTLASGELRSIARKSIAGTAINPDALYLLAVDAEFAKAGDRSNDLLTLSEHLSRRALRSQFLLIEKRVEQGDIAGTLLHYDRILRTSPESRPLLFGMFNHAAEDQNTSSEIARLLSSNPSWLAAFLDWLVFDAAELDHIGAVLIRVPARDEKIWTADRKRRLITKMVSSGQYRAAFELYRTYAHVTQIPLLRGATLSEAPRFPPIEWAISAALDLDASLSAETGLTFRPSLGARGAVLSQLLNLPSGRYRLTSEMSHNVGERLSPPAWTMACVNQGEEILRFVIPATSKMTTTSVTFDVPAGCGYQWLRLMVRASEATPDQSAAIRRVSIERIR